MPSIDCDFCDLDAFRTGSTLVVENDLCLFANSDEGENGALIGSGVIIPKQHRETVFDLTAEEIASTFTLLAEARQVLDDRYQPDGYTVGWNSYPASGQAVMHAHLHVLVRFLDEPESGHGIRWHLKQATNRRPDPMALGGGLAIKASGLTGP